MLPSAPLTITPVSGAFFLLPSMNANRRPRTTLRYHREVKALLENLLHRAVIFQSKIWRRTHGPLILVALVLCSTIYTAAQTVTPSDAIALEQQGRTAEAVQAWRAMTRQHPRDA